MVLRLAYFVLVHSIPHELCLNGDHTGIMFTLAKGKMWITKAMHESKDKSVNNHGEKRQFTVLATTSAAGQMLCLIRSWLAARRRGRSRSSASSRSLSTA